MSGLAKFEVEVGADISGLQTGLAKAGGVTQAYANKVNQSFQQVAKSSNTAGQSLQNLSRIASDSPFGFIGIQNNLEPLIDSFRRLKAETGSTGSAFKSLLSSLGGVGGIGLGISVLTAAVSFATNGFGAWTRGLQQNKAAAKEAADAYGEIVQNLAKEQVKVDLIVTALKTEVLTRQQRSEAIKQLQQISPAYFASLDKEKATIGDITLAYDKFSQSILRSIEARVREKELLDVTEKIIKLRDKAGSLGQDEVLIGGKMVKINRQRLDTEGESLTMAQAYKATLEGTLGLTTKEIKELQELEKTRARLLTLISGSKGVDPFVTIPDTAKKAKKAFEELRVKFREEPIEFIDPDQLARDVEAAFAKIKNINAATINIPLNIEPTVNTDNLNGLLEKQMIDYLKKNGVTKGLQNGVLIPIEGLLAPALKALFEAAKSEVEKFQEKVEQLSIEMQQNTLIALGENIGTAFANMDFKGGLGAMFSGIFNILGGGLKELGKYLIVTSKLIQAFKVAFKAFSPAGQLIAGIGLVALGALIQSKASQIPGFADGVNNFRGGLAVVGERGPELVNLPSGSNVIPNHNLNGLQGSNTIIPDVRIDGRDIVLVFNRAQKSLSITG